MVDYSMEIFSKNPSLDLLIESPNFQNAIL